MKIKKTLLWTISVIVLIGISITSTILVSAYMNNKEGKYFVIGEQIHHENKLYIQQAINMVPIALNKKIGVTDDKQQVFEIQGQKPEEWICVIVGGVERVFREQNVPYVTVDRFETSKLIIKEEKAIGGDKVTVDNLDVISKIVSSLKDENAVKIPEEISNLKQVVLISDKYAGLSYNLYYEHDSKNNICLIFDVNDENHYKIGHDLMPYVNKLK